MEAHDGARKGHPMRAKRDTQGYQPIKLEPEQTHCPECAQPLRFAYRSDRHVAFLENRLEILYDVRRCRTPGCPGRGDRYLPEALRVGMLPKYEYGLDVIALIGHERLRTHARFADIGEKLRKTYGVPISDRSVEDHFALYLALISTDIAHDPPRLERLRKQGKIVLAIDAAQPEHDQESLWVLRDVPSEETLLAFSSASAAAEILPPRLRQIKALGIPITGVISDAQEIILSAVEKVLPGVPHQLCQIHFLKDFAKNVTAADHALEVGLGKRLRGLSAFERAAAEKPPRRTRKRPLLAPKSVTLGVPLPETRRGQPGAARTRAHLEPPKTPEERVLIRDVCELLRAILKHHGRYPLKIPGVQMRDMLQRLREALDEGLKKGELDFSSFASSVNTLRSP